MIQNFSMNSNVEFGSKLKYSYTKGKRTTFQYYSGFIIREWNISDYRKSLIYIKLFILKNLKVVYKI